MTDTPLAGLSIVVTRPREQAVQLRQRIEQLGGQVILFPLLEISPPNDAQSLHDLVKRLAEFDLAIFISPNAVRYGLEAISAAAAGRELPPGLCIATVGQGSARALREAGVAEVIAPPHQFDSESLLAMPQLQNIQGWKVLIFRGDGGRELLGETLKKRGAMVEYACCYQRKKPSQDISMLLHQHFAAITLSSSEALAYLWDALSDSDRKKLAIVPLFVPHARIREKALLLGWQTVVKTAGGDDGVVQGLVAWAKEKLLYRK